MSTRSTIALEYKDGSVEQIYCHHDGYLDGVGNELKVNYTDPSSVEKLIDLGDISELCETAEKTEAVAYAYSRGEELVIRRYIDLDDYYKNGQREAYNYLMQSTDDEHTWLVQFRLSANQWVSLDDAAKL